MDPAIYALTGMYIAYPTSPVLKSIYRTKNYKTEVNDQHTKVGKARNSFHSRRGGYLSNFDNEVEFVPVVAIDREKLDHAEQLILKAVITHYKRVGRAREWFQTADRERIIGIITKTLNEHGVDYRFIGKQLLAGDRQNAAHFAVP